MPLAIILAYLIGSVPFGLLLPKMFGYGDIRKIGSGNIGATNVLRTGNKKLAFATLVLDGGKGAFAIYILCGLPEKMTEQFFLSIDAHTVMALLIGLFAIIGHCYPVWLKFKGGKGVATTLGVLLAAVPFAGMAACAAWLVCALITRISSLSALVAALTAPVITLVFYGQTAALIALCITALVFWRHRENIRRLLAGTEPKIGKK